MALDAAVAELDSHPPDNVDRAVWERLCSYRRAKIEFEMNVSCHSRCDWTSYTQPLAVRQWLCGRVPDLQLGGCRFESRPGLLRTKVYSAFHPSGVGK